MKHNAKFVLSVMVWLMLGSPILFAQNWELVYTFTNLTIAQMQSLAVSADGTKVVAVANRFPDPLSSPDSPIYVSTDSGTTWTNIFVSPWTSWGAVACSADGTKLTATVDGVYADFSFWSQVYSSTNGGLDWNTSGQLIGTPSAMAASADGAKLAAAGADIYTSTNFGATWSPFFVTSLVWSVASSGDGSKLVATRYDDIYISTNYGATWTPTGAGQGLWFSVASSVDGGRLIACGGPDARVYISTNSGTSWTATSAPSLLGQVPTWKSVASSANGKVLAAAISQGQLYTSLDWGTTWSASNLPDTNWIQTAISADGRKFFAVTSDGKIYSMQTQNKPTLNISVKPPGIISWIVPSTNFVLQQSMDLIQWANLTNNPVLNLTNLQNEITLPNPSGNVFFRLATQ